MKDTLKRFFLYDTEPLEMWLDVAVAGWGAYVLLPFNTFGSSGTYKTIASLLPEQLLGLFMLSIVASHVYGMVRSHQARRYALISASTLCLFIMLTFAHSNPYSTGIPTFFAISMGYLFSYVKVTSNL